MKRAQVEALIWAYEITWRQSTDQDAEMRERIRMMIPAKDRPYKQLV